MDEFAALVLEDGQINKPADRLAAARGVGEAERVGGIFEYADLPADIPLFVAVEDLDAGEKAVVERPLEGVLGVGSLHEVEPAAAREMLVAVGVFLIAHSDGAEDRKLAHLQPEVGDGGQRPCVAFRRIDLVVDVDLVDEVVFAGPVIHLVHPALDTEPGAAHVHGVGETGVEATLIG